MLREFLSKIYNQMCTRPFDFHTNATFEPCLNSLNCRHQTKSARCELAYFGALSKILLFVYYISNLSCEESFNLKQFPKDFQSCSVDICHSTSNNPLDLEAPCFSSKILHLGLASNTLKKIPLKNCIFTKIN